MTVEIELSHQFKSFALDVAFSAPAGVTALYGRSGSGKTTIINAIAGLLTPNRGRITINGNVLLDTTSGINVATHKRRVGYVFQDSRLFPHLTVARNLVFAERFIREPSRSITLQPVVELLGISHLLKRRPATLSGGEKQRVAIGRALLANPHILLLDEPLAALDEARKSEILPYIERLRDELDIPIIYVSHSISEVARLATSIVGLTDGKVARAGPAAEVLADPDTFPMLEPDDAGSILTGTVAAHDETFSLTELTFDGGRLIVPLVGAKPGTKLRARVRARDIILALRQPEDTSALNILPAVVHTIGQGHGASVDVAIRCGNTNLVARITRRSLDALQIKPGMACFAVLKSVAVAERDIGTFNSRILVAD